MRFAVVGDPIDHSRSPAMHNAGFQLLDIDARYEALRIPYGGFDDVVRLLRDGSYDGVNVTMPHKSHAFDAVDHRSDTANRTQSVNTITMSDGSLVGHNTDVDGVRMAVELLALPPETPVLLLGAGGAARAAAVALEGRELVVSARRAPAARALIETTRVDASTTPWGSARDGHIIVNATPIGMHGESLPTEVIDGARGLLDMTYGRGVAPAVVAAQTLGLPVADGITMLVGQAVRAFLLFTDRTPPWDAMERAARTQ